MSPRKILVSFFPFPPTPPRLFSNPPACSVSFSSSFFMYSARGARLRRGYCRAKRGGRAARATEGASLSVARSAAGVFRALCAGETLEARQTAGNSPRVAVRRGTREGEMALRALHLTQDRSLCYCAPFTAWATQRRSNELLRGLGPSRGPSRAERRGASGASSPRPREGPWP